MCMYLGSGWSGFFFFVHGSWEDRLGWISGFLVSWTEKEIGLTHRFWFWFGLDEGVSGVIYFVTYPPVSLFDIYFELLFIMRYLFCCVCEFPV